MPETRHDTLLASFTEPRPYTMQVTEDTPGTRGVHAVLDDGAVVFVGWTANLRRRLRQHLVGPRGSSSLHEQIGQLLDTPGDTASATDVTDWLSRRTVRWLETNDPRRTAEALADALMPCFNRRVPKPRSHSDDKATRSGGKRRLPRVSPGPVTTDTGRG